MAITANRADGNAAEDAPVPVRDLPQQRLRDEEVARKQRLLEQAATGTILLTEAERTSLELDLKALTRTTKRPTIGSICVVVGLEPDTTRDACKIVRDRGKHSLRPYGVQWLEIRVDGTDTTVPGTCRLFIDGEHRARKLVRRDAQDEFAVLDHLQEEQLRLATLEEEWEYEVLERRVRAREGRGLEIEDFAGTHAHKHTRMHACASRRAFG
jgi:hypothetical protein